jgi:hypothetical protein
MATTSSDIPESDLEGLADAEVGAAGLDSPRRSALALLRDIVLSLTRVAEDSTELVGASVHEELARFRDEMSRRALALAALLGGAALFTAGLAIYANQLLESWALTLTLFGVVYLAVGILVCVRRGGDDSEWK